MRSMAVTEDLVESLLKDRRVERIMVAAARHYHRLAAALTTDHTFDDFYAAALVGVWKAAGKVDPAKGFGFLSFVRRKVRWACADHLRSVARRARHSAPLLDDYEPCDLGRAPAAALADYLGPDDPRLPLVRDYYLDNRTLKDVARRNHIRPGLAKALILWALADIRKTLERK
jgi:hypothetical protein